MFPHPYRAALSPDNPMIEFLQAITAALALSCHVSDPELQHDVKESFLKEHRKDISLAGVYSRDMIYPGVSGRAEQTVEIQRFRYKKDGRVGPTHSLISDALIPFGSYTVRFVLHVLRTYYGRTMKVRDLCAEYGISASTLYVWKATFEAQASRILKSIGLAARLHSDLVSQICSTPCVLHLFHCESGSYFLRPCRPPRTEGPAP